MFVRNDFPGDPIVAVSLKSDSDFMLTKNQLNFTQLVQALWWPSDLVCLILHVVEKGLPLGSARVLRSTKKNKSNKRTCKDLLQPRVLDKELEIIHGGLCQCP